MRSFQGAAKPLTDKDVSTVAGYLGVEIAAVRAIIAVESAGKGFAAGRPVILNEPHIFYRELGAGSKRDKAVAAGLAYLKARTKPYPKTQGERYAWLAKAAAIDETAALRSCSWGLGQLMGFNHVVCGFPTIDKFLDAMMYSEGAQLFGMARFIVGNGLQKHVRSGNWAAFAKGYNGPAYAVNQYDTKLAAAYAKRPAWEKTVPEPASVAAINELIGANANAPKAQSGDVILITAIAGAVTAGSAQSQGMSGTFIAAAIGVCVVLGVLYLIWRNRK